MIFFLLNTKIIYDRSYTKYYSNFHFNLLNQIFCYKIIFILLGNLVLTIFLVENAHSIAVAENRIVSTPITIL